MGKRNNIFVTVNVRNKIEGQLVETTAIYAWQICDPTQLPQLAWAGWIAPKANPTDATATTATSRRILRFLDRFTFPYAGNGVG